MSLRRVLGMALVLVGGMASVSSWAIPRVPIEGGGNYRWSALEQRLGELRSRQGMTTVRVLQLGDSHTAGIHFSGKVRTQLFQSFGQSGTGILPPGKIDKHPPLIAGVSQTSQWTVQQLRRRDRPPAGSPASGALGLGGLIGFGSSPFQMITYEFPSHSGLARFIVYSDGQAPGSRPFRLYEGDRELQPAEQRSGPFQSTRSVFHLRGSEERLTLVAREDGRQFRLFGVSALSFQPGIMFSRIGLNGATFGVLSDWDTDVTRAQIQDYAPHLLILEFGTNDVVNNPSFAPDKFRNDLLRAADWVLRHAPDAAVLLVMPPHAPNHGEATNQNLKKARGLMRQVAEERGWRTWDWSALTAANCSPQCRLENGEAMFQPDGIHLTRGGYEASGEALVEAISGLGRTGKIFR